MRENFATKTSDNVATPGDFFSIPNVRLPPYSHTIVLCVSGKLFNTTVLSAVFSKLELTLSLSSKACDEKDLFCDLGTAVGGRLSLFSTTSHSEDYGVFIVSLGTAGNLMASMARIPILLKVGLTLGTSRATKSDK